MKQSVILLIYHVREQVLHLARSYEHLEKALDFYTGISHIDY